MHSKRYLKQPFKLRTIILLLAAIAFLSAAAGGILYIRSLRAAVQQEAQERVTTRAVQIERDIIAYIGDNQKAVRIMAGVTALSEALRNPQEIQAADDVLDRFQRILDAGVCFLMDRNGKVIASTNRHENDSFIGFNYAFRPYFKAAMEGRSSLHMASTVTSNRRGIFYSAPVRDESVSSEDNILGVAIINYEIIELDKIFQRYNEGLAFLVSSLGVIFSTSDTHYLLQVFGENSAARSELIQHSKQFGEGPWPSAPFVIEKNHWVRDTSGNHYLASDLAIDIFPGWRIIYIEPVDDQLSSLSDPLLRLAGAVLFFIILISGVVFFLYRAATGDIAQKKNYADALRQSELKFRSIVEHTHEGIVIVDESHRITYANEMVSRLLVIEREDMIGQDFRNFLDESSRALVAGHYRRRQMGESVPQRYECTLLCRNGLKRRAEISATIMKDYGGQTLTVGLILDITERVEALEAIKESEIKYRTILESIQEGYFEVNLSGKLTFFNDALCAMAKRSPSALMGLHYRQYMDASQARTVFGIYNKVYHTGQPALLTEFEILTGEGRPLNVEGSCSLIRDKDGNPVGFRGVIRDVSEKIEARKALKESEARYRTVLEGSPDPMVVYDMKGRLLFVNPAFTKVFGWTLEECSQQRMDRFVPEEEWPITNFMIEKVRAGEVFFDVETYRLTKTGEKIPVSISGSTFRAQDHSLQGSIINIRDIRHKRRLESQLRQAQKMEALGILASGVAHDFNNLLQTIYGYVQLLARRHSQDPGSMKYLEQIDGTIGQASKLVSRMLTFSRKMKPEFDKVNLGAVIDHAVVTMEKTIPYTIEIETSIPDQLQRIYGDSHQLEQMLVNLGINAGDAMPRGGRLVIRAENVYLNQEEAESMIELDEGPFIRLTVSDNGTGMDKDTQEHLFEPFFTTKAIGQGSGLGLYSIYGIVQAHGGYISCHSQVGIGTKFEIHLPALTETGNASLVKPASVGNDGANETILLVDDEDPIREVAQDLLESSGYRAIQARDGEEALASYQEKRDQIDLVILDLGMPGMGGQGCLNELLKLNPDLKVIIASGYSDEKMIKEALSTGARDYIHKPYRLQDLLKKVRRTLDQSN